jgi:tetratricopeptide (TPR) repeat protein
VQKPRRQHIDWVTLVEFHEGLLDPAEAAVVRRHLEAGCELCTGLYEQLGETTVGGKDTPGAAASTPAAAWPEELPELPQHLLERSLDLVDQFQRGTLDDKAISSHLHRRPPEKAQHPHRMVRWGASILEFLAAPPLQYLAGAEPAPTEGIRRLRNSLDLIERIEHGPRFLRDSLVLAQVKYNLFTRAAELLDVMERHQEAVAMRENAVLMARRLGEREAESRLLRQIGTAFFNCSEYARALAHFQRSLALARTHQLPMEVYQNMRNLGCVHSRMGNVEEAVRAFREAIQLARKRKVTSHIGSDLLNLSIGYRKIGDFERALLACEEALELGRDTGDLENLSFTLVSKSNILSELGEHEGAIDACREALELFEERNDRRQIAMALLNIGNSYNELGCFEEAIPYFERSIVYKEECNDVAGVIYNLVEMGRARRELGQVVEGYRLHHRAHALGMRIESDEIMATVKYQLALDALLLGRQDDALHYGQGALRLARSVGDDKLNLRVCLLLARIHSLRADESALRELHRHALQLSTKLINRFGALAEESLFGTLEQNLRVDSEYTAFIEQLRASA